MAAVIVRGVELTLHSSPDYVSDVIWATGDFYEAAILDELATWLADRPPGVLVDAGAMIGNHTAYLAAFVPHTAIHAFEPIPANVELLRANAAPFPTVTVHPVALSHAPGVVHMAVEPGNLGHALVIDAGGHFVVEAITLDSLELADVRLLKIDVEGHEPAVLAGAARTIARWRPLIVLEDWHGPPEVAGYTIVASWERTHQTFLLAPTEA